MKATKTSKEMQLKIIDKMKENIENGKLLFDGIERRSDFGEWIDATSLCSNNFDHALLRVKPKKIVINGVSIDKPLDFEDIDNNQFYYIVSHNGGLYERYVGSYCIDQGYKFVYRTQQEAIEASRLLGMMGEMQ